MANEYETSFLPAVDKCFFHSSVVGYRRAWRKFGEYTTVSSNESVEWGIKKRGRGKKKEKEILSPLLLHLRAIVGYNRVF